MIRVLLYLVIGLYSGNSYILSRTLQVAKRGMQQERRYSNGAVSLIRQRCQSPGLRTVWRCAAYTPFFTSNGRQVIKHTNLFGTMRMAHMTVINSRRKLSLPLSDSETRTLPIFSRPNIQWQVFLSCRIENACKPRKGDER